MAQPQTQTAAVNVTLLDDAMFKLGKGDKDALAFLYEHTRTAVYAYAMSVLHSPADAQDVLQNTYVRLYETAPRYVSMGKPMAWVLTIARNLCLMHLRQQKKQGLSQEDLSEWDNSLDNNPHVTTEDRIVLYEALEGLGEQERQVVMLHAVTGLRHREIADMLKLPLSTVLSKYSRAVKRLHAVLKEEGL